MPVSGQSRDQSWPVVPWSGMEAPLLFAVWLVSVGFWIVSLVDAGRWSSRQWGKIGRPKTVWMIAIFLTGVVGAAYYWAVLRRLLKKKAGERGAAV